MHRSIAATSVFGILIAALGCSTIFGPDEPELSLAFNSTIQGSGNDVSLEIRVGNRRFDLELGERMARHAPGTGDFSVTVTLLEDGEPLATEAFEQRFVSDSNHWINAQVGGPRPDGICIGTVTAVPVGAPVFDSLFVVRGGLRTDILC